MANQRYFSNIYWHFTGSPKDIDWREVTKPADITKHGSVLEPAEAVKTLGLILGSSKLRATCTERVVDGVETEKFCCVTDIPLKDLPSHSPYYGKVAIGFKAGAVHRCFIPVLYIPKENLPTITNLLPNPQLVEMAFAALGQQTSFEQQQYQKLLAQANAPGNQIEVKRPDALAITGFFLNFVKMTDFDTSPENTFYREREWRNVGDFTFTSEEVAAIVVPDEFMGEAKKLLSSLGYPPSISVVAWEFIESA